MNYRMTWGSDGKKLEIPLPESWKVEKELLSQSAELPKDTAALLRKAMREPVGMVPLSQMGLLDKKILIVIDDYTRPTPVSLLFPEVRAELSKAGVKDSQITILVAVGTHAPMTMEEIGQRLGLSDISGLSVFNHNAFDNEGLVHMGDTEGGMPVWLSRRLVDSDLAILIGTIEPHPVAGYGGGLKNVLPGCAGEQSIACTHLLGDARERYFSVGKMGENVLSRKNLEAGASHFTGQYFIVNSVMTPEGKLAGVFCGHPVEAHRRGCELAERFYCAQVQEKYDVLLLSSHPMDTDFRQGSKSFLLSHEAVKEGGLLIAFLYCERGVGDMELRPPFISPALTKRFAQELGAEKLVSIREEFQGKFSVDELFMNQLVTEAARRYNLLVYSPNMPKETEAQIGAFEIYHDMERLMRRAAELAPANPKVAAAPYGGVIFAKQS